MAELIDRKKLIDTIMSFENCENGYSDTYDKARIISAIEEEPTVISLPITHNDKCYQCGYIRKDVAMSHPFANGNYDKKHADMQFILGHESYKEWLEDLPAADVRENDKAKWIFKKGDMVTCDDGWSCSHCKCTYHTRVPYFKDFSFCPNCGACMNGGDAQ